MAEFNAGSPVLKRGIALTPVKFGISFNLTQFNQAGALVHVYVDGSVLVNHSATEMGQGVNTKVRQVVAQELGVPLERVRSTATATDKVANTSATAASTGSDMNGKAAQAAARRIRDRIAAVVADRARRAAGGRRLRRRDVVSVNGTVDDVRRGRLRGLRRRARSCGRTASTRPPACTGTARRCRATRSSTSATALP